jgi:hypothetical protein
MSFGSIKREENRLKEKLMDNQRDPPYEMTRNENKTPLMFNYIIKEEAP